MKLLLIPCPLDKNVYNPQEKSSYDIHVFFFLFFIGRHPRLFMLRNSITVKCINGHLILKVKKMNKNYWSFLFSFLTIFFFFFFFWVGEGDCIWNVRNSMGQNSQSEKVLPKLYKPYWAWGHRWSVCGWQMHKINLSQATTQINY